MLLQNYLKTRYLNPIRYRCHNIKHGDMEYIKENLKKFSLALTPATESEPPPNVNQVPTLTSPQSFTTAITPYSPTIYHHRRRRSAEFVDAVSFSRRPQQPLSPTESDIESGVRRANFQNRRNRSVSDSSYSEYSEKSSPRVQKRHNNVSTITGAGGHINPAFLPSTSNIHESVDTTNINNINTQNKIYREQYWTWSCKCQSWTKCEKILLLIIAILFCIVCGLVTLIAVFAEEIHQMKDGESVFPGIGGVSNILHF